MSQKDQDYEIAYLKRELKFLQDERERTWRNSERLENNFSELMEALGLEWKNQTRHIGKITKK